MRMRDMKDALKGKTERLERAEALLIDMLQCSDGIRLVCDRPEVYNTAMYMSNKIEKFLAPRLDKHE